MCEGCFLDQWEIDTSDGLPYDLTPLRTYLAQLSARSATSIRVAYESLMRATDGRAADWIGGFFQGALHAAIDDDNYTLSFRVHSAWDKDRRCWTDPQPLVFSVYEEAVLDLWDALDENERALVVGFLHGYSPLVEAMS